MAEKKKTMLTQQEKEIMFLDLNDVLVKFWIEQGRPDKEIKIELLERMLNWNKKAGIVILDEQGKDPVNEDLEEAADNYIAPIENDKGLDYINFNGRDVRDAFIDGAEWQEQQDLKSMAEIHKNGYNLCKEQMLKEAVEGKVVNLAETYKDLTISVEGKELNEVLQPLGVEDGDKVKIIIIKED